MKCRFHLNQSAADDLAVISQFAFEGDAAWRFHHRLAGYAATPLVCLPHLAAEVGVGELWVKDESRRLGLNAFKVLGASFVVHRVLQSRRGETDLTFTTATDGNHGRAVAWAARNAGRPAVVFMPAGSVPARVRAIESEGATVHVIDGDYDAAVLAAANAAASRPHWVLVQDTAWPGYKRIPAWIMAGYLTIMREMEETLLPTGGPRVDCVLLQAGVGSWAAAAAWWLRTRYGREIPGIVCVEPTAADCMMTSAIHGRLATSAGDGRTIMAGLNCGTPSSLAWPILHRAVDAFMAIDDEYARRAMRMLYQPGGEDLPIVAGESGASGLAGLLAILSAAELVEVRQRLRIGPGSRVLVFNTEGATDPISFERIVGSCS